MSEFWVNIPELRATAAEIEAVAKHLEFGIAEISRAGSEAGGCLSGGCSAGIVEQLRQLSAQLANGKSNLGSMASALVDICNAYESNDKKVAGSVNKKDMRMIVRTALHCKTELNKTKNDKLNSFLNKISGRMFELGTSSFEIKLSDGSIHYNWTKISNTLKKSAGEITPLEYAELAAIYIDMDDKSTARFLELLASSGGTIHNDNSFFTSTYHYPNDYEVWSMDYDKIRRIQANMRVYSDSYDFYNIDWDMLRKESGLDVDEIDINRLTEISMAYGNKQYAIIQKSALMDACCMFCDSCYAEEFNRFSPYKHDGHFNSEAGSVSPGFSIRHISHGRNIEFAFRSTALIPPLAGNSDDYYHLHERKIIIGKPSISKTISTVSREWNNYFNEIYSPDLLETLGDFFVDGTLSVAISSIPVLQDCTVAAGAVAAVVSVVYDQIEDSVLNDAHNTFYQQITVANVAQKFGMVSIPVWVDDVTSDGKNKFSITYPTYTTEVIIKNFNDMLHENGYKIKIDGRKLSTITYETIRDYPMEINVFLDSLNENLLKPVFDPYMFNSIN